MSDQSVGIKDVKQSEISETNEFKKLMDQSRELTKMIRNNEFPNENTQIFYQLPLDDDQRQKLYNELLNIK